MKLWERLKREIGNPLTTVYCHRGDVKEYHGTLRKVDDCFSIDYGSDYMDFNFASSQYNIYQLIDKNGTIIYENPRALHYYDIFTFFDDILKERYRLFGYDYLRASLKLKDNFIYNSIKYSDQFRKQFEDSILNPKNNLSYWFPRIKDAGFKTPITEVYPLTEEISEPLINFINNNHTNFESSDYDLYYINLLELILTNTQFISGNNIFIKSGVFSNKFNFETCTVNNFAELPFKFFKIFKRELQQARGKAPTEIVLREFISTNNNRKSIYNGLPLNTEFRVFYDFDKHKVLGIENYWNPEQMENGLQSNLDINNYLDEQNIINEEFKKLKPVLEEECKKLKNANLSGNWSIDFMWTGQEFVLIDMALAECSSYWEKYQHLAEGGVDISKIEIPDGVLPAQVQTWIKNAPRFKNCEEETTL